MRKRILHLALLAAVCLPVIVTAQGPGDPGWEGGTMYYLNLSGDLVSDIQVTKTYTPNWVDQNNATVMAPGGGTHNWNVTGGTIISESSTSCQVKWTTPGTGVIEYEYTTSLNYFVDQLDVTVNPPPPPTATFTTVMNCNNSVVSYTGAPGSAFRWYWQTSASGTATSAPNAAATYTLTSTGNLYLRTRTKEAPFEWSTAQSVGSVTVITTPPAAPASPVNGHVISNAAATVSLSAGTVGSATSYRWHTHVSSGTLLATTTTPAYSPTLTNDSTSYYIESVNGNCASTSRTLVKGYKHPLPVITTTSTAITRGDAVTLSLNYAYGTYQWIRAGADLSGKTSSTLAADQPGKYKVRVTKGNSAPVTTTASVQLFANVGGQNMNYVTTSTVLTEGITNPDAIDALPITSVSQATQYIDGLGRPMQTVTMRSSPAMNDVVQPVVYDKFGLETKKYLPYVATQENGHFKSSATTAQAAFYNPLAPAPGVPGDAAPYSVTIYEPSPLGRVLKQGAPGTAWQPDADSTFGSTDHTVKFAYEFNEPNEVLRFTYLYPDATYLFGRVNTGSGSTPAYYAANYLSRTRTKDEEGHQVVEYKDPEGKVILKKVHAVTTADTVSLWAQTYYIYDDFGQLVCVIPPEATKRILQTSPASEYLNKTDSDKKAFLERWAFRYAYDARRRMTMKQVPGAGAVYMVYDQRDRLVATQDANQRSTANKYWTFTKYDELNRPILTGIKDTSVAVTQAQMQTAVNNHYAKAWTKLYETYVGTAAGNIHGYSNKSYPVLTGPTTTNSIQRYLSVTYYDNYNFKQLLPDSSQYTFKGNHLAGQNTAYFKRLTGQVTGTKVKVLDAGNAAVVAGGVTWLTTVNYYDDDYRVIQAVTDNYKSGQDRITSRYDFSGKVLATKTTHVTSDITWKDITNVAVIGNRIVKYEAVNGWTAGAASREQLGSGQDGWLEFTSTPETNTSRRIGFNDSNPNTEPANINYLIDMNADATRVYENGSIKHTISGATIPGDVWRIKRTGTQITYYRNSQLFYTSLTASTGALLIDCSIYNPSGSIARVGASFAGDTTSVTRNFTYDHAGRMLEVWHKLDSEDAVLLTKNTYNELGQLIDKKLHSTDDGETFKQSVDHSYNIRGWLTKINESDLSVADEDANRDLFGMQLLYNESDAISNEQLYNGNISGIKWSNNQALGDLKQNAYVYSYDPMNRIVSSAYKEKTSTWASATNSGNAETGFTYDLNGNIKTLQRNDRRASGWMDNLTYDYGTTASNKLLKVTDSGDKTKGFIDVATSADDYTYDANGNLLWDRNKGGAEMLANGSFDSGNANWGLTNSGRLTFTNNEVQIATGAAQSILQQSVVTQGRPYVVVIDMERTSGTLEVYVGSTAATFNTTGVHTVSVTAGANSVFSILVPASFAGKIKSISLKGVTVITYNLLNLPEIVTRAGDKQLQYIYDASGRKLKQLVSKNNVLEKSTDYASEYIYENDTLQFINHEEGRILPVSPASVPGPHPWEYQYHLKDHLGNVRLTFTTNHEIDTTRATMETANLADEASEFLYYDEAVKINSTIFDHTNAGGTNYALRLTGMPNHQYGLAKSLSVMPGDTIRATVYAKYLESDTTLWNPGGFTTFMNGIRWGTPGGGVLVDGGLTGSTGGVTPPNGYVVGKGEGNEDGAPKAYLNFLIFDRDYNLKDGGYVAVTEAAREYGQDGAHEELFKELAITEPGYVYLYLSNDNAALGGNVIEVFFDDFRVEHIKSPVIQQDDYYAFGLNFNSYQREDATANQYLYNGKERQEELDIGWLDYGARMYMPEIGRFFVQDRFSYLYYDLSPYQYAGNNSINFIDINGDSLSIAGDAQTQLNSANDIASLMKTKGVTLAFKNGNASLDFGDMSKKEIDAALANDPGLALINDMINADENYVYTATTTESGEDRETGEQFQSEEKVRSDDQYYFSRNLSVTPRNTNGGTGPADLTVSLEKRPGKKFDGYVRLTSAPGEFYQVYINGTKRSVSRASVVFHELAENYARTTLKMPYERLDGTGAHQYAEKREGNSFGNASPGNVRFRKKDVTK